MRAFLFPHDLLTEKAAYIAALHQDNETARATLGAWLRDFDPETLRLMQAWGQLLIRQMYDGADVTRKRFRSEAEPVKTPDKPSGTN